MSFLQSYLAEIIDALKARDKKKEAKRQAAIDARIDALQLQQQTQRTCAAAHRPRPPHRARARTESDVRCVLFDWP